ncbi:D-TA family PLP-dependent enzyme [Arcticibacter sp. MXS-1]|uniref:D-TA family PLP-dependent enzyme n=1 Tax=Arcticibacter sp. MXS-1 TaxID=3341726 RepID=UPI0035A96A35
MCAQPNHWFFFSDLETVDSPALVVYEDHVRQNIDALIQIIGDVRRLRVHVKTHKCREATQIMLDAGIRKFKCATIAEAEMLGMVKADDVLLAYQPLGPKIDRLMQLIKRYPHTSYSCLVDHAAAAMELSLKVQAETGRLPVFIDVNVGMNRTGIHPDGAVALFELCASLPGLDPIGLHVYDGHIHDADLGLRTAKCDEAFTRVESLRSALLHLGFDPVVIAGGTPTFPVHAKRGDVECSPGTFIYWDKGYASSCAEQPFVYAALIICRVVSLPSDGLLCVDVGHKSVAAENELKKRIYFLNAPELEPISQSEEHLVVNAGLSHQYRPGDILFGVPHHVCPTVALYEKAIVIKKNKIAGEWKTIARDRKINC